MIMCVLDLHKVLLIVEVEMSVVDKSQHGTWVKFKNPKPNSNSNIGYMGKWELYIYPLNT